MRIGIALVAPVDHRTVGVKAGAKLHGHGRRVGLPCVFVVTSPFQQHRSARKCKRDQSRIESRVVGAVVTLDDFDEHGATVPHARCIFKDYVYELWSADGGRIMAFRHELEVVHNEPTLAAAAAWIKDGPNDPVKHRGLVPVRDTNVDHNIHTALVHLWSVNLLERFADDGAAFVQVLRHKWEQGEVTSTFFPQRPDARGPSEWEDEDSEGDEATTALTTHPAAAPAPRRT